MDQHPSKWIEMGHKRSNDKNGLNNHQYIFLCRANMSTYLPLLMRAYYPSMTHNVFLITHSKEVLEPSIQGFAWSVMCISLNGLQRITKGCQKIPFSFVIRAFGVLIMMKREKKLGVLELIHTLMSMHCSGI